MRSRGRDRNAALSCGVWRPTNNGGTRMKRQGIHAKTYPIGAIYRGHYVNDKRHGFGFKIHADGVTIKIRYYERGLMILSNL